MLERDHPELISTLEGLVSENLNRLFRGSLEFQPLQFLDSGEHDGEPIISTRIAFSGRRATRDDARRFFRLTMAVQSELRNSGYNMTFCPSFSSKQGWEQRVEPSV